MTHDPEKTSDFPSRRLTPTVSVSKRDWTLWAARNLFALAFAPIAVIAYYFVRLLLFSEIGKVYGAVVNLRSQVYWCGIASVCLATASGVLYGLSQLMRERRFPTPSGADYEKADLLSTIAVVFCFALIACMALNPQPIMAAVWLSIAILWLWPELFGSRRRR